MTRDIDLAAWVERAFATPLSRFAWFLAIALLTRVSTFGDPDYHNDELLFFLIGQRMHDGLIPYVDIWDRKGPGLFLVYYLIAGLGRSVVGYQLAACLFATATACVIDRTAARFAGRVGALLGGTFYLVMLPLCQGGGGQAPVFYNLFMAIAFAIVLARIPALRAGRIDGPVYLAMASAGFALTFKQTAAIEGAFLGCCVLWQLWRGGMPAARLASAAPRLAAAGAAPMLGFALIYAAIDHFPEFWHALVTSNLAKAYNPAGDGMARAGSLLLMASPLALPALAALTLPAQGKARRIPRAVFAGWIGAAALGVAVIPNFIDHYLLPALLPLAVTASAFLGRGRLGPIYAGFATLLVLMAGPSLKFAERQASRQAMAALVTDITARDPAPRLFVYQGPVYLYSAFGTTPPTPLVFPMHLFHAPERDTSHLDTAGEVGKVLAWRPTVIVRAHDFPPGLLNPETVALVDAYQARCRLWFTRAIIDYYGPQKIDVYGDCPPRADPARSPRGGAAYAE